MSDEESIFKRKSKKSFCCDKNFIKKKSVWNFHSKFFLNKRNKLRLRNDIKEFEKMEVAYSHEFTTKSAQKNY